MIYYSIYDKYDKGRYKKEKLFNLFNDKIKKFLKGS